MTSLVDDYLHSIPRKEREAGVLYVTDLTKPCLRSAYYGVTLDRDYDVGSQRVFETGRLIEDFWVHVLENTSGIRVLGKQVMARYKTGDFEIHGRVDALCQHNDGALVVHEVKSAKSTVKVLEPKEEHWYQLQFYLTALGVDHGQVDYLDKAVMLQGQGPSVEKCFRIERDPAAFAEIVRRGRVLSQHVSECHAPEANQCWLCGYCLYESECKGELKLVQ